MFSPGNLDFHFPLFTTCMHMVVQFLLASLVLYFLPHFRPRSDSITNLHNHARIHRDPPQTDKPLMTKTFYLTRIGPCGAATGLDIGLGNMSLKFITLTFFSKPLCTPPNLDIRLILCYFAQQCANPQPWPLSCSLPSFFGSKPPLSSWCSSLQQ